MNKDNILLDLKMFTPTLGPRYRAGLDNETPFRDLLLGHVQISLIRWKTAR